MSWHIGLYSETATHSWFDRVSVLARCRVLACGIEKNGITLLDHVLTKAAGSPFGWLPFNAAEVGLNQSVLEHLLTDSDSGWRSLVVYRDPMERFLSAYHSKCLHGDQDGWQHCHDIFKLNDSQITILNVARRLPQFGHSNPHWALQTSFCGKTVGRMWRSYTHRISFNHLAEIAEVFEGRVQPDTLEAIRSILAAPSGERSHITHSNRVKVRAEESIEVRRLLYDFYAADYRLFISENRYGLERLRRRRRVRRAL